MTFPLLSRTFLRKLSFHFWFPVPGTGKGTAKKRGRAYDGTKGSFLPAAFLAGRSLGGDSLDQPILPVGKLPRPAGDGQSQTEVFRKVSKFPVRRLSGSSCWDLGRSLGGDSLDQPILPVGKLPRPAGDGQSQTEVFRKVSKFPVRRLSGSSCWDLERLSRIQDA